MDQSNKTADASNESSQTVARFEVRYTQLLNHQAEIVGKLPEFARDPDELIRMYRYMLLTRAFDAKAIALQRTGKMGTYGSVAGQEAIAVGLGAAMHPEDVLLPTYREHGAYFQRGVAMEDILRYWGGDERGMCFANQAQDFPMSVPIASHLPHAAGVAYAMKLRKQPRVAVAALGDGATSKGDFYEAINLAGVWQLPMVVLITNNEWAISVPRHAQSRAQTLAQKAIAAGIPGEQVDGNDLLAVRARLSEAIENARNGGGPAVIEALTYRWGDHTTADDASRYRTAEEVEAQKRFDPLIRTRSFLDAHCGWDDTRDEALHQECVAEVEAAVQRYLDTPPAPMESMFDYLYETLPESLQEQRQALIDRWGGDHG
jgi:pyruvate dehydrogenase E1 component alpha subunit